LEYGLAFCLKDGAGIGKFPSASGYDARVVADQQAISRTFADYGTVRIDTNSASTRRKKWNIGLCGQDD